MGRPLSQCGGEMRGFEERAKYMIEATPFVVITVTATLTGFDTNRVQ